MLGRDASVEVPKCLMFIRLRNSPGLFLLPGCPVVAVVPIDPYCCRVRGALGRKNKMRRKPKDFGDGEGE